MAQALRIVRAPLPSQEARLHRLGSLLARWHQWRRHFSTERRYARQGGPADPEDELEAMLMATLEAEIDSMPLDMQRALQHVARAECMGVETIFPGQVPADRQERESLYAQAMARLEARLRMAGIL